MAIGVTTTITASVEIYDALHAAMLRRPMPPDVGLMAHAARATADGVEILEIWESRDAFDRFMHEVAPGVLGELAVDGQPEFDLRTDIWEVRGLVIPSAKVAV